MNSWSLKKKILVGSAITLSVVLVAIAVGGATLYTMVKDQTVSKTDEVKSRIVDSLELTSILYNDMVGMGLRTLKETASAHGKPRLGEQVKVGTFDVSNLYLGDHSVYQNYEMVDKVKQMAGGTATLFVRSGERFVRISTNVQKSDGKRAVGTELSQGGKAIKQIQKRESYYGVVDILGKQYYTAYEPMIGDTGDVVGIWYTGYRLDSMTKLRETIAALRILDKGFFSVVDDRGKVQFQSDNAQSELLSNPKVVEWLKSGAVGELSLEGWILNKTKFSAWNYDIVSVMSSGDLYGEAAGWAALLLGPMFLLILAIMAVALIGINRVTGHLNQAIESLANSSQSVDGAAQQLSASSQDLAMGASDQAASLEETSSILQELTATVQENSETAKDLDEKARRVQDIARQGAGAMKNMIDMIEEIKTASDDTAKIIKTIDEIAFQTNLLALNAAVEAARAGDAGKGFAVVAEEVRNLAKRSADAAKDTNELIQTSQEKSELGVSASGSVDDALNQVTQQINEMVTLVRQVAGASRDQTDGINQINTTVGRLGETTQNSAAAAQETSSASGQLVGMVETLNHIVEDLIVVVHGGNRNGTSHVTAELPTGSEALEGVDGEEQQLLS